MIKRSLLLIILCLSFTGFQHSFACTTFLISGKSTADGKPILFKNRDTDNPNNALECCNIL